MRHRSLGQPCRSACLWFYSSVHSRARLAHSLVNWEVVIRRCGHLCCGTHNPNHIYSRSPERSCRSAHLWFCLSAHSRARLAHSLVDWKAMVQRCGNLCRSIHNLNHVQRLGRPCRSEHLYRDLKDLIPVPLGSSPNILRDTQDLVR
jgi:hypothetical protein